MIDFHEPEFLPEGLTIIREPKPGVIDISDLIGLSRRVKSDRRQMLEERSIAIQASRRAEQAALMFKSTKEAYYAELRKVRAQILAEDGIEERRQMPRKYPKWRM